MSDLKTVQVCQRCGFTKDRHRPEAQAHHSECTLEQFVPQAAPPVEPCPKAKALDDLLALVGETVAECEVVGCSCANATTFGAARKAAASPCSPCPRCAEERERADSNYASCERIKRKFEEATAERDHLQATVKALVEGLKPFANWFQVMNALLERDRQHGIERQGGWEDVDPVLGALGQIVNRGHFRRASALVAEHADKGSV